MFDPNLHFCDRDGPNFFGTYFILLGVGGGGGGGQGTDCDSNMSFHPEFKVLMYIEQLYPQQVTL